eukprot:4514528-Pyramimonas_sp.AAC.1
MARDVATHAVRDMARDVARDVGGWFVSLRVYGSAGSSPAGAAARASSGTVSGSTGLRVCGLLTGGGGGEGLLGHRLRVEAEREPAVDAEVVEQQPLGAAL